MTIKDKFKDIFKQSTNDILKVLSVYILLDLILRLFEYFLVKPYFKNVDQLMSLELSGYYHDVFKLCCILFFVFPLYFLISLWSRKIMYYLLLILLFLFVLVSFFTIQYYIVAFVPLDGSFFDYSLKDLLNIVMSSGDVAWMSYVVLVLLFLLFFLGVKYIVFEYKAAAFVLWGIWIIAIPNVTKSQVRFKNYDKIQDYYLVKNKALYFIDQAIKRFSGEDNDSVDITRDEILSMAKEYSSIYPERNYTNPDYPIFRKREDKDVLGKYFDSRDSLPNIVYIMMEGMGRNICGPNARYGSFTPFLDSLIKHSLYWENILSNAERTYGAIPNIVGSLPFGYNGFHYHEDIPLPNHKTIITYLKNNNYRTGFYYGGWTGFQNMNDILSANKVDFVLSETDFDSTATKIKSDNNKFSWGYDDMSVFSQYLKHINSRDLTDERRLDMILSISLHGPFMPPREEHYNRKVNEVIKDYSDDLKKELSVYMKPLATTMYADDALKNFFKEYSNRKDFGNTIFVMVADHNIHAFPDDNAIRKYHVPLIIYSPMLKQGEKFSAVGSHQDITPSLMSFLQHNYVIDLPDYTLDMSNGLDDTYEFRCIKTIPLLKGSEDKISLIHEGYLLADKKYYRLKEDMFLIEGDVSDEIKSDLDRSLKTIIDVNKYIYVKNKIIPTKYTFD